MTNRDISALLQEAVRANNPLARAMAESEAYQRVDDLRERLGVSPSQLDLSIKGLTTFENMLIAYLPGFLASDDRTGDDILLLFREMVAYIGLTFVRNTNAEWVPISEWLWGTDVEYRYTTTGVELPRVKYLHYPLEDLALQCWQACQHGQRSNLAAIIMREKRRKPRKQDTQ